MDLLAGRFPTTRNGHKTGDERYTRLAQALSLSEEVFQILIERKQRSKVRALYGAPFKPEEVAAALVQLRASVLRSTEIDPETLEGILDEFRRRIGLAH